MKVGLYMLLICVWILNKKVQICNCNERNENLNDEASNQKWISQQRQKQHLYYPKHHKRENYEQIKSNLSVAPYAVGMEEALYFRQHYIRENDGHQVRLRPDRDYNKLHFRAHRIMNGHRVVPHHLAPYGPKLYRPDGYIGVYYKSSMGNDSSDAEITTKRSGLGRKFLNLRDQLKHLFVKNQSHENARAGAPSENYPKLRKRSEFESNPIWEPVRKPWIKEEIIPHGREESQFVNKFIIPSLAQLSLEEKSSGKFHKQFHIICETDEETQSIQCKNSETHVIHKEEDSEMETKPNIRNMIDVRSNYQNFNGLSPKNGDYMDQE